MKGILFGAQAVLESDPVKAERAERLAPVLRVLSGEACVCTFFTCTDCMSELFREGSRDGAGVNVLRVDDGTEEVQYAQLESLISRINPLSNEEFAVVLVDGLGAFSVSKSADAARDSLYSLIDPSIRNQNPLSPRTGRMSGKIAVITGGAQGFGKGIARRLFEEGACVVVADRNAVGACSAAKEIGNGRAGIIGWEADVSCELSTKRMISAAVLEYGGLDIFINNAGVNTPGGIEEMDLDTFERICKVNYTAYYLGVKYASRVMKLQQRFSPGMYGDIIQINSKSGIAGSNKNFAYAGSKFGGIGLTQSFALELAPHNIKVNSICPGNYFESPLWADPESGMFALYLKAGKVPGAKTVEDVRRSYEEKVPLGRGCRPEDLARAVMYLVEQEYETGQAVPVTGGQIMLK